MRAVRPTNTIVAVVFIFVIRSPSFQIVVDVAEKSEGFPSIRRINAVFRQSIEYPQVIKQSSTGASVWCLALVLAAET
jgi:hypothetical protein